MMTMMMAAWESQQLVFFFLNINPLILFLFSLAIPPPLLCMYIHIHKHTQCVSNWCNCWNRLFASALSPRQQHDLSCRRAFILDGWAGHEWIIVYTAAPAVAADSSLSLSLSLWCLTKINLIWCLCSMLVGLMPCWSICWKGRRVVWRRWRPYHSTPGLLQAVPVALLLF